MKIFLSLFLLSILLLAGCQREQLVVPQEETPCALGDGSPCDSATSSDSKPTPPKPAPPKEITATPDPEPIPPMQEPMLLMIETVDVLALESFPVQYKAQITGNYRNGCEQISGVEQSVSGTTVTLKVKSMNFGEICTQALVPFSQSLNIDSASLNPGEHTLVVNDITTKFNVQ